MAQQNKKGITVTLRLTIIALLLTTLTAGALTPQEAVMGAAYRVRGAAVSAWTPAGEVLWIDGSDTTSMNYTNISGIFYINSVSSKGTIPLTIPNGIYRPQLVTNGLNGNSIILSSVDKGFSISSNTVICQSVTNIVLVSLVKYNGASMAAPDNGLISLLFGGFTRARLNMAYATTSCDGGGRRLIGDTFQNYTVPITNVSSWHIYAVSINYALSNLTVSIDGNQFNRPGGFQTPGATTNTPTDTLNLAKVYGWWAGGVISHSCANLQKIEGFYAWKYGLQTNLPPTHPYYGAAP